MMSVQDMSDRLEIQDILTEYCHAIDNKDWAALDDIFTPDAHIDYSAMGGAVGSLDKIKVWLDKAMKPFPTCQHIAANPQIRLSGDTATTKSILFNPMVMEKDGAPHVFFCGGWYCDEWARTDKGWRIKTRREESGFFHNFPEDFKPVDA